MLILARRKEEVKPEPLSLDVIAAFLNNKKVGYDVETVDGKNIHTVGETGEKVILSEEEMDKLTAKTREWLDARRAEIMKGIGL